MRFSNSTKSKHETEDGVYIVESIIGERVIKKQRFYKVRWEGFSPNEDSWEPESNLSSVRTLIKKFQLKQQSISTLRQRPSKKGHAQAVIDSHSNKSNRDSLHKRRMTKSRVGHFEYVPQNELVAAKTKYFDDIRNGKIDLISNDLYSRVKTRRRCCADTLSQAEESSLVRPSSLTELNDCSGTYRSTPSRYSAPSTPKTFGQSTDGSIDECVSAISNPPSNSLNRGGQIQVSVSVSEKFDPVGQQNSSLDHHLPRPKIVCQRPIKQSRLSRRYRRKQTRLVQIPRCSGDKTIFENLDPETTNPLVDPKTLESVKISEHNTATSSLAIIPETTSQEFEYSDDLSRPATDISAGNSFKMSSGSLVVSQPHQTVSSSVELMSLYFDLVNQYNHSSAADGHHLADLPVVKPLDDGVMLTSESEIVTAINNQYWSILAAQPIEKFVYDNNTPSSSRTNNSQNLLVAAVIGGEGKPFLLRRLLRPGSSSDFIDPISGWPLLVIAVYFGRVHAAQVLLESGAQPDASILVGGKPRTALGVAITTGNVDMVSLLILSGANFYKVEENTTALKFIIRLLQAVKSNSSYDSTAKASVGSLTGKSNIFSRFNLHSPNPELMPIIQPPEGVTIPRSPYDYLLPTSANPSLSIPLKPFDGNNVQLPTADVLSRLYELISCHHARLSLAIDSLVRRWLSSVGMALCSLVMPCQWISLCEKSFNLSFSMPQAQDSPKEESALVLFLIHGIVTPPGVYHVWVEEDGPCFVGRVMLNNVEQRALGRRHFVSTLHPLDKQREEQLISVQLTTTEKGVCIAAIVIRLKPIADLRTPNNCNNTQDTTNMPRLRSLQSVSGLRQRLH